MVFVHPHSTAEILDTSDIYILVEKTEREPLIKKTEAMLKHKKKKYTDPVVVTGKGKDVSVLT